MIYPTRSSNFLKIIYSGAIMNFYTQNIIKKLCSVLLLAFMSVSLSISAILISFIPSSISIYKDECAPESMFFDFIRFDYSDSVLEASKMSGENSSVYTATVNIGSLELKEVDVNVFEKVKLVPGGMQFGLNMHTDGVMVVGMSDVDTESGPRNPCRDAGIKVGDIITHLDGKQVLTTASLSEMISNAGDKAIAFTVSRGGNSLIFNVKPIFSTSSQTYKTGIWIRDNAAGIGTITYIDPKSGRFGGLGHGECDSDTGELIPMSYGSVSGVTLTSITKGKAGAPGELSGYFNGEYSGTLTNNTHEGVFGILDKADMQNNASLTDPLPIALRNEIAEGNAQIISSDGEGGRAFYDVTISSLDRSGAKNRNFVVKVTDPDLLALTGGIVQGMSGSPIIQNGKLIGAVTHVLVNDPTRGYGIFIENMLKAAG